MRNHETTRPPRRSKEFPLRTRSINQLTCSNNRPQIGLPPQSISPEIIAAERLIKKRHHHHH
jgi:hypothetical protein